MSKIMYAPQRFTDAAQDVITQAEAFCAQYAAQGYQLTLRQLYYRFIATDAFPESRRDLALGTKNTEKNYKWLGDLVSKARVGGLIDWNHITDRGRETSGGDAGWPDPESAVNSIARAYGITHWNGQPEYIEVWVEKDALSQVIEQVAGRWDVLSFACKGSPSTSAIHEAALRLRGQERAGRKTTVIYLGDHDPTGLDISRDIQARLDLFRSSCEVDRIALNWDQITDDLPPSPVKVTDSRTSGYIDRFGTTDCWELDALEPQALDAMIETAILEHLDRDLRQARLDQEEREREILTAIYENFRDVRDYLASEGLLPDNDEDGDEDGDD
jgi:hypothetical protein